jgi:hypothetical protein
MTLRQSEDRMRDVRAEAPFSFDYVLLECDTRHGINEMPGRKLDGFNVPSGPRSWESTRKIGSVQSHDSLAARPVATTIRCSKLMRFGACPQ